MAVIGEVEQVICLGGLEKGREGMGANRRRKNCAFTKLGKVPCLSMRSRKQQDRYQGVPETKEGICAMICPLECFEIFQILIQDRIWDLAILTHEPHDDVGY